MRAVAAWAALWMSSTALAFDVESFDGGLGTWAGTPALIGQSSTPGWVATTAGDDAGVQTSPTTTQYTYYWRLTQDIDLTAAAGLDADLLASLRFHGGGYESARIEIGPVGSTRAADFTTLWETTTATEQPETFELDLADWEGTSTTVRVVLKKGSGVVLDQPGLSVFQLGVVLPPPPPPPPDPVILEVGAFNVQVFGRSKMGTAGVPEALVDVIQRYDLVLIQEIRDATGTAFTSLMSQLDVASGGAYASTISQRLGRTSSKEQYAYVYRVEKLDLIDAAVWPDPTDAFEREPYVARFETVEGGYGFTAVGLHAAPDDVVIELAELALVYDDVAGTYDEDDIVLLGDLNAGCTYLRPAEMSALDLRSDGAFAWWIGDDADTTTTTTLCPYDRLITTGGLSAAAVPGSAQPMPFDQYLGLSLDFTRKVSDHYPVSMLVDLGPGGVPD